MWGGGGIQTFLVATYVVASQPPERRPTGTPTTRANFTTQGYRGVNYMPKPTTPPSHASERLKCHIEWLDLTLCKTRAVRSHNDAKITCFKRRLLYLNFILSETVNVFICIVQVDPVDHVRIIKKILVI